MAKRIYAILTFGGEVWWLVELRSCLLPGLKVSGGPRIFVLSPEGTLNMGMGSLVAMT